MKPFSIAFIILTLGLLAFSTYQALFVAPTEQTMGEVQRIFYYHVPSAWVAGVCFFVNFLASIAYIVKRNEKADALAAASAEVGVVFCTIVLHHGTNLGASGLGYLVDMGRAAYHDAGAVADLRQLSHCPPLRGGQPDANTGSRYRDLRLRGCTHRLHVDTLVSHTAPVAGHGRG